MTTLRPTTHSLLFFFNDTATTEIYTLSLHDALPIYRLQLLEAGVAGKNIFACNLCTRCRTEIAGKDIFTDRKSTRLNSSHQIISYAVFCLKKKITIDATPATTNINSPNALERARCIP